MAQLESLCDFRRNPLTLEHTSAVASAALLTRRAALANPSNPSVCIQDLVQLPLSIEQKIDPFLAIVKQEMDAWKDFLDRVVFFDRADSSVSRAWQFFDLLVWSSDGSIDGKYTAQEMLKLSTLSAEEKYRIACNHCLDLSEIKKLRQNLNAEVDMRRAQRYYPLLYYWECVCRKSRTPKVIAFVVKKVFDGGDFYPACAIDYFLNVFKFGKRFSLFCDHELYTKMPFKSFQNFLMKLSGEELYSLMDADDLGDNIIAHLVKFWMYSDFALHAWTRTQKVLNAYFLQSLIDKLIALESPFTSSAHISVGLEIWNSSPYSWQYEVFEEYISCDLWDRESNLTDVRLDVAILSCIYSDYRLYKFWPRHWLELFKKYPLNSFHQLMNVCCEGEELQIFKNEVMNMEWKAYFIEDHYYNLITGMKLSQLNYFLSVFSSDPDQIMKTKQMLLRHYFIEFTKWFDEFELNFPPSTELVNFIEESFASIRAANEFKIEVLSSVPVLKRCYSVAGSGMFDWLKDTVWTCGSCQADFEAYKGRFLKLKGELQVEDVFKDPAWQRFLEWCEEKSQDEK